MKSGSSQAALWQALNQFANYGPVIDRGDRAPGAVKEVGRRINAQDVIDRVVDVAGTKRTVLRNLAARVCGTYDDASFDPAAAHQDRHGVAPVIASGRAFA